MQITNSPDITQLIVQITWDISGALPVCTLENLSTGANLANVSYAFVTTSPSGTPIHAGVITSPDVTGVWSTFTLNDSFPKPMNSIEWSGAPYQFYVIAKDSVGNIYTGTVQYASICRPNGNTQYSKNTYGIASSDVQIKCQDARIFFQDQTYTNYKGLTGVQISSVLNVVFPIDETLTIPAPFVTGQYSTALVPISYSSDNYQFVQYSVYDYDLGNNTLVRIKYQTIQTFAVWCNIDLLPLVCEINKLIETVEHGNCSDVNEAQRKLNIVMSKFVLVSIGIQQPLTGVNVPKLIDEIIEVGGFDCDCCGAATGIIPTTASIIDGYSFSVNKLGGDVAGNFSTNGNNITLNIGDISYVVAIGQESPSNVSAFSFSSIVNGGGFLKTYLLNIDGQQMALDVLANIGDNPAAVNALNELITIGSSNFQLIVDGGCIFSSTASCNYTFTLSNIPATTTFALLTSIKVGNISHPISFSFNGLNLSALQAYLNTLGYGTCIVTNLGSGQVSIYFGDNTNELIALTYKVSSTNYIADFSRECTGYMPISANQVVQNIIDYLCGLTDTEVDTSQDYTINYLDTQGNQQSTVVTGGSSLNELIIELLDAGNSVVSYVKGLGAVNCTSIQAVFPTSINTLQANDYLLGTKQGLCARILPNELLLGLLQYGAFSQEVVTAFCKMVTLCNAGIACTPFSIFSVTTAFDSPADNKMDLILNLSHPIYTSAAISISRIDIFAGGATITNEISLPATNLVVGNVNEGQYQIIAIPLASGLPANPSCPSQSIDSNVCGFITSFGLSISPDNSTLIINYTASCPYIYLNVSLPNGSFYTNIVANTGSPINIVLSTISSQQYGDFTVYLQPVCNVATNWKGNPTAPAVINIPVSSGFYKLSTTLVAACAQSAIALYTKTPFGVGVVMYTDITTNNPVTGSNVLVDSTGALYSINSTTGVIQYNTGFNCNNGSANTVILSTSPTGICSQPSSIAYTNGVFAVAKRLYTDSSLTTSISGMNYVVFGGIVYNLDSSTGTVGSATGATC